MQADWRAETGPGDKLSDISRSPQIAHAKTELTEVLHRAISTAIWCQPTGLTLSAAPVPPKNLDEDIRFLTDTRKITKGFHS
jgi:hypothetical protein